MIIYAFDLGRHSLTSRGNKVHFLLSGKFRFVNIADKGAEAGALLASLVFISLNACHNTWFLVAIFFLLSLVEFGPKPLWNECLLFF